MKQKELTSAPYYRADHQGKMTCNLPASLLNINMKADGPRKSARDFGAARAFFQKQAAWDAKMEDKVGDFKE